MIPTNNSLQINSVCALTQGENTPSSRFRWRQYLPILIESGIRPFELFSRWGAYPPKSKILRAPWFFAHSLSTISNALDSNNYDLRFLQREMISTLHTSEYLLNYPFVFDVDDSIFINQRFSSVDKIAKKANIIICGNDFLANYFSRLGEVKILPTAIDIERFIPTTKSKPLKIIGWSGTSSGLQYLNFIEPALKIILNRFPDVYLKIISDRPPVFTQLPNKQLIFEYWNQNTEVKAIQDLSIGIMPLKDTIVEKGKCSFKMLTYMSVGVPVVVSNVGMNIEVLNHGDAGFLVSTIDEWVDTLTLLLNNQYLATNMGKTGRNIIKKNYSTKIIGSELAKILKSQC